MRSSKRPFAVELRLRKIGGEVRTLKPRQGARPAGVEGLNLQVNLFGAKQAFGTRTSRVAADGSAGVVPA